ncbi:amino acid permease [Lacticaseibacillus parakribbianus]|uniref:amino acid permease n=1 Tax=Lacticaseibacillus parakribbianus TaxID=2970927 RepID=UPI0021CB08EE|nr:amino acid permease [Lacticaseibacillus parakribbianus]
MSKTTDQPELSRSLKSRHIQLIAIGGTIGTGLFLGAGQSIHQAGPSILLAYLLAGGMCFFLMRAMGELLLSDLSQHSFVDFIGRYLGRGAAFVTGWTYWVCWLAIAMAEVTAVGMYIRYWLPQVPQWVPGLVALLILLLVNLISVGLFGEAEFWFALIKVVAIIALIVVGAWMIIVHYRTGSGTAGLSNLVSHGGLFPKGLGGFLASLQMVTFSFAGVEMVGLTASETANPKQVIPEAINELPVRIILFYIGALFVIMCIYPWSAVSPTSSPFVQVFDSVGIRAAADIINFVVLTAAASACNSSLFSTGRMLFSLTLHSPNPRLSRFGKLSRRQVPANAILASTLIIAVAVVLNMLLPGGVFKLISSVATTSFLFVWGAILVAHLKFRRLNPTANTFKAPWFPVGDYLALAFLAVTGVVMLVHGETAVPALLSLAWLVAIAAGYRLHRRRVQQ